MPPYPAAIALSNHTTVSGLSFTSNAKDDRETDVDCGNS